MNVLGPRKHFLQKKGRNPYGNCFPQIHTQHTHEIVHFLLMGLISHKMFQSPKMMGTIFYIGKILVVVNVFNSFQPNYFLIHTTEIFNKISRSPLTHSKHIFYIFYIFQLLHFILVSSKKIRGNNLSKIHKKL